MQLRYSPHPNDYSKLGTDELRRAFLVESLFTPGQCDLVYTDADRAILGSVVPVAGPIRLVADAEMRAAYFCERRELGVLNIGGSGVVTVDGGTYPMGKLDCLYAGRGSREVAFTSLTPEDPAAFFLLSYPAHAAHPVTHARMADATPVELGAAADANRRTIYKYIHSGGIQSCQLVMGLTALEPGNVWNSFPSHTHWRRTEIYFYFDLGDKVLSHFYGEPQETRHLFLHNEDVALSPNWSMHFGVGTGNYKFIWGMAGENQVFDDMDAVKPADLR